MDQPVFDFLQAYTAQNGLRLHMPGHKGRSGGALEPAYQMDITEIAGADSLFDGEGTGIIAQSEKNAARLFGSRLTCYSAGGSTLCIQTMLALTCKPGDSILAGRNAHRAFFSACVLLGLEVQWLYPEASESLLSCPVSAGQLQSALEKIRRFGERMPVCVYITSPDYYGQMADVASLSRVCRQYGLKLLIDNAHGAHLAFLPENRHPIALGADLCCDSAHKTLPVLTGGAYLHVGCPEFSRRTVKEKMALFGSTSPSYLILSSLDQCNVFLNDRGAECMERVIQWRKKAVQRLSAFWHALDTDPIKITVDTASQGMTGTRVAALLREKKIECEYADEAYIVLLFSLTAKQEEYDRLTDVLLEIAACAKTEKDMVQTPLQRQKTVLPDALPRPKAVLSLREAALSPSKTIPVEQAVGRICGCIRTLCPPGVPVVAPGEIFDEQCMNICKKAGIFTIDVVE